MIKEKNGWITVTKSFYITFDGRRCYCNIPELFISDTTAQMVVKYKQGDEESYSLQSKDGRHYYGAMGTDDDNRVDFTKWVTNKCLLLSGNWKCGGREGEWYIEGLIE